MPQEWCQRCLFVLLRNGSLHRFYDCVQSRYPAAFCRDQIYLVLKKIRSQRVKKRYIIERGIGSGFYNYPISQMAQEKGAGSFWRQKDWGTSRKGN